MGLSRKQLILQSGERYSCLVDDKGVPDFWTTLFFTTHYRSSSHETMRGAGNALVHFKVWEEAQGCSFYENLISKVEAVESQSTRNFKEPVFFSVIEAQSLARHCKLTTKAARRNIAKPKNKIISLADGLPVAVAPDPTVALKQQRNRLKIISEFLAFVVEVALRHYPHYAYYLDASDKMSKLILKQKPKRQGSKSAQNDPDKKAPPPEVFDEIMRIAKPDCADNPFTRLVKVRNYLIARVFYDTGVRAGELLQLKVEDIDFSGHKISIKRRHDDPEDIWRALEPNAKTLERDIPISHELTDLLRDYVTGERRQMIDRLSKGKSHGFLFVSSKITTGQPMSIKQLSKLILKLAQNESLASFIEAEGIKIDKAAGPHSYRHNRNNQISQVIDTLNRKAREEGRLEDLISEKKEKDIRMYLMGHKHEKSAQVYNLRHTKESAEKLNLKVMEEVSETMLKAQGKSESGVNKEELSLLVGQVLGAASQLSKNEDKGD